jgi:short-subunit dehydrogenase involved in D-alanine esterification of teichoic acids
MAVITKEKINQSLIEIEMEKANQNKIAIVTGGASGIGLAIAEKIC